MYFDSFSEALFMAGHGAYVWGAYGLSLSVLGFLLLSPVLRQRRLMRELRGELRRAAASGADEPGVELS